AEDGIRARNVTGVQTCALPISLELTEAEIIKGLEVAHKGITELLGVADQVVEAVQQPKMEWTKAEPPADLVARVKELAEDKVSEIGRASCREREGEAVCSGDGE